MAVTPNLISLLLNSKTQFIPSQDTESKSTSPKTIMHENKADVERYVLNWLLKETTVH